MNYPMINEIMAKEHHQQLIQEAAAHRRVKQALAGRPRKPSFVQAAAVNIAGHIKRALAPSAGAARPTPEAQPCN